MQRIDPSSVAIFIAGKRIDAVPADIVIDQRSPVATLPGTASLALTLDPGALLMARPADLIEIWSAADHHRLFRGMIEGTTFLNRGDRHVRWRCTGFAGGQ